MKAQIFSPDADAVRVVIYPSDSSKTSVFIFHSPPGKNIQGSLSASLFPDSIYNFEWFQYNPGTGNFDTPLITRPGVSQSQIKNLSNGGYQVVIRNGFNIDTSFTAWVHIDKLLVSIVKDQNGKVRQSAYTCDYLTLSGDVTIDTFYYYDPLSHEPVIIENGFTFLWASDNSDLRIPNANKVLDPNTTYKPPYLDTWYILTAVDSFGMQDVDSVLYESIQIGPDPEDTPWLSFKFFDKKEKEEFIDPPASFEGDAPLTVKFTNKSVNGFTYEWIFSDTARSDIFANEFASDTATHPEYIYKIPNDYYPSIVVTSEAGCIDTFTVESPIVVLPSELEVPNVFSPDGNGLNDYFTVKFQSIKEFNVRIYNRAGKLVYKAEVNDMYKWDGWDGKILGSEREASPGAYFYVIDATGWDKEHFRKGQYRGVVYLFRYSE